MSNEHTEAEAVAKLAEERAAALARVTTGHIVTRVIPEGYAVEEQNLERFAETPAAKRATIEVHTAGALIAYAKRHLDPSASTFWVDAEAARLIVVLNDHEDSHAEGVPGWADHRVVLTLRRSPEWKAWVGLNEKNLTQQELAEFLEEHISEIAEPDGATMLEVAQTFHATVGANFTKAISLHSGEQQLVWEETVEAKAGRAKDKTVPRSFTIAIAPFEGDDPVLVHGTFRFRVKDGHLTLGFRLLNLEQISRDAVERLADTVTDELGLIPIRGIAPGARR